MDQVGSKSILFVDVNVLGSRLGSRIRESRLLDSPYSEGRYKLAVLVSCWRNL